MADETHEVRIVRLEEGAKHRDKRLDAMERRQDAADQRLDRAVSEFRAEMQRMGVELRQDYAESAATVNRHLEAQDQTLSEHGAMLQNLWQAIGERKDMMSERVNGWYVAIFSAFIVLVGSVIAGISTGWRF